MSLLDLVRTKLTTDGVVEGSTGFICRIGHLPDTQDKAVGLTPSGGFPQDTLGRENTQGSFQVKIRTGEFDYDLCISKWQAAFNSLQDAEGSITGVRLMQALNSEPLVWYDDKRRPCASLNIRFLRARP